MDSASRTPARPHRATDDLDRILCDTGLVVVGRFCAPPDHSRFTDSGPIRMPVFVFPRTGVEIRHEGDAPFAADACTVTYYNRGQRYTRRALDPRGDHCDWFSIREDVLADVLAVREPAAADRPERPFGVAYGPSDASAYALQRAVVNHVTTEPVPDRLAVEEAVVGVLAHVHSLSQERRDAGGVQARRRRRDGRTSAQAARAWLIEHFRSTDSLETVARAANSSVFHLCRAFRAEVGTTIHAYRLQLRLRRSLELVADADADLTAVALELGFSSHSHFTSTFRRVFGETPSEFRRRACASRVRELSRRLGQRAD